MNQPKLAMDNEKISEATSQSTSQSTSHYTEITSWEDKDLNLKDTLLRGIYSYGFEKPSSIQKKAVMPFIYGINGKRKENQYPC